MLNKRSQVQEAIPDIYFTFQVLFPSCSSILVAGARATVNWRTIHCCPDHQHLSRDTKSSKNSFEGAEEIILRK